MKKLRAAICILIALAMVLVFCACDKKEKEPQEPGTTVTDTPKTAAPDTSSTPGTAAPEESTAPESQPPAGEDMVLKQNLIITSMSDFEASPHEIQPGTVLKWLAKADVPSQLPWNCGPESWFWTNVFEGLSYLYLNDPKDIRGAIAESWEHSDDYLTWTYKIRDGVKFTDGTVCDAFALARSYDYRLEASPATFGTYNITSWEALDANTLVFHLSAPCPYFEIGISGIGVVSPDALDLYGINDNKAAIGTGPYYIDSYTSGVSIELKANPDYYLPDRKPSIERVSYQIVKDANTAIMALMNGDLDGGLISTVENYYNIEESGFDGYLISTYDVASVFWFNAKSVPVFQTFEVRNAMSRFIDWPGVNELIYDGMGNVQDGMWPEGTSGYVPFDENYYAPDEGLELLASAGVDPKSIEFNATIVDFYKDVFVSIQNELSKVDVTMNVESIEAAANFTLLMNGEWTVSIGGFGYTNAAPYAPWTFILTPNAMCKMCWQDVYDPELYQSMLDEYDAVKTAATWDEMIQHLKQLTKYQQDDFGCVGAVQAPLFIALSKEFKSGVFVSEDHAIQVCYMYK